MFREVELGREVPKEEYRERVAELRTNLLGLQNALLRDPRFSVAIVIAALTLYPDFSSRDTTYIALFYTAVFERAVSSVLLVFLAIIAGFLVWFPVPLSRNTIVHAIAFGMYFSAAAILLLLRNVGGPDVLRVMSTVNLVVQNLSLVAWILFLTKRGERRVVVFGHRWRPEQGDELIRQLDAINDSLMRMGRK